MRCVNGHAFIKKDGPRMIKAGVMVRSMRNCAVCRKEWKQSVDKV